MTAATIITELPVIPELNAANVAVSDLNNDSVVLRLHMTINHLSRWLTPVHDQRLLAMKVFRGDPSVKELLEAMRDEELVRYPMLHAMAARGNPDLDKLPDPLAARANGVREQSVLSVMAEFRRLRQSTCGLLRSIPNDAWKRVGTSRKDHDWQIRTMSEYLIDHDTRYMYAIDEMLDRIGVREGVAEVNKSHYEDLLRLVPVSR